MTYAELTAAKSAHETAAKIIRYAGFKARCIKNTACEQPYQVNVSASVDECKDLQVQICKLLKNDTINIVAA